MTNETPDERRDRINNARRESAEISQQVGIEITSLLVRPVARQAWHEFRAALRDGAAQEPPVLPRCNGREAEYVDYDEPPTAGRAQIRCTGCPFLEKCRTYSDLEKPGWGIYGGNSWVDGRKR